MSDIESRLLIIVERFQSEIEELRESKEELEVDIADLERKVKLLNEQLEEQMELNKELQKRVPEFAFKFTEGSRLKYRYPGENKHQFIPCINNADICQDCSGHKGNHFEYQNEKK